jgi:hypothetical protein
LLQGLIGRTIKVWRSRQVVSERKRLEKLYPQLPRRDIAAPLGADHQATRLASIVRSHCDAGNSVVSIHATATLKLDATEYAFSSLLDELRGVMTSMPTDWAPMRAVPRTLPETVTELDVRAA